jgi:site-specific DNA recombinase
VKRSGDASKPKLRCAIYTRKSSEEGLDQAFNSLHAQREACEAYIRSQTGENWVLVKTPYDDGGISGGTMERPGLRRLLSDIDAGRLDVVVVYKVDRLTRSLGDFARIVERFDERKVSFVSVTQQFNTTSSMGRLTLNVLLSFAQFEREVTGERIRDKITASKKKGMWMGGKPPLGYDPPSDLTTRALVINPAEAEVVRHIFARYLELKSVGRLCHELRNSDTRSKAHITKSGRTIGGRHFSRGALFHLLKNPIFAGRIPHRTESYPGNHPPIIELQQFEAVQALLVDQQAQPQNERRSREVGRPATADVAPLRRLVFDADDAPMSPSFSRGRDPAKRYRYYVSTTALQAHTPSSGALARISAHPLETFVLERVGLWAGLRAPTWPNVRPAIRRIQVHSDVVFFWIDPTRFPSAPADQGIALSRLKARLQTDEFLDQDSQQANRVRISIAIRLKRRGNKACITTPDGQALPHRRRCDHALVKGLRSAHALLCDLHAQPNAPAADLLLMKRPPTDYQRKLVRLAYLAPDIQAAILDGRQPGDITLEQVMTMDLPVTWVDQRTALGFSQIR